MDEALTATFMFLIFGWCLFFVQGDRDYNVKMQAANNATYRYTQVVSKKGELNEAIDGDLKRTMAIYGDFDIEYQAERFEPDNTITKLTGNDVVGYNLRDNDYDIIKIRVVSKKDHYLTKIMQMSPMGSMDSSYKLAAQSSAYIQ